MLFKNELVRYVGVGKIFVLFFFTIKNDLLRLFISNGSFAVRPDVTETQSCPAIDRITIIE